MAACHLNINKALLLPLEILLFACLKSTSDHYGTLKKVFDFSAILVAVFTRVILFVCDMISCL
jgi:hypothetical protein